MEFKDKNLESLLKKNLHTEEGAEITEEDMQKLEILNLGKKKYSSLAPLSLCVNLQKLTLYGGAESGEYSNISKESLEVIGKTEKLDFLSVIDPTTEEMTLLAGLENIKRLTLIFDKTPSIVFPPFTLFKHLKYISFYNMTEMQPDFSGFAGVTWLESADLFGPGENLEPLDTLPNCRTTLKYQ